MTDEQINAEIAEACGWKLKGSPEHQNATDGWQFGHTFAIKPSGEVASHNSIPNYCGDLNAMHEAEKVLTDEQCVFVRMHLRERLESHAASRYIWHATARQRAEAFLRTLGKWEE